MRSRALAVLIAVVAATAPFSTSLRSDVFLGWDDTRRIVDNPYLNPPSLGGLVRLWSGPHFDEYTPVSYSLFALQAVLAREPGHGRLNLRLDAARPRAELNARVFHAGSLILHAAASVLVLLVLLRLRFEVVPALVGSVLYAVHPLQVESVAWISQARGVASGVFGWMAVLAYLAWLERSDRRWMIAAAGAFTLSLLCKATAVSFVAFVPILHAGVMQRPLREVVPFLAPWAAVALVVTIVTAAGQSAHLQAVQHAWLRAPFVALDALAFYLGKLIAPFGLATDYGRTPGVASATPWFWVAGAVPLVLAVLAARLPGRRLWLSALLLFVTGLAPVLGLVPFAYQYTSTVADRYAYLALFGAAVAVAGWLTRLERGRGALAACAAVLVLLAAASASQTRVWRDDRTLFSHTLEVNPRSYVAHMMLAAELFGLAEHERAAAHLREAAGLRPAYWLPWSWWGVALLAAGERAQAMEQLARARALEPVAAELAQQFGAHRIPLGVALLDEGRPADALWNLRLAAELAPDSALDAGEAVFARALRASGAESGRSLRAALERRGRLQQ